MTRYTPTAASRRHDGEGDGSDIQSDQDPPLSDLRIQRLVGDAVDHQRSLTCDVEHQQAQGERRQEHVDPVDDDRGLDVRTRQVGDQQVGRERKEAHEEQHQEVDPVRQGVGVPHQLRHPRVAHPDPPDEGEADQVAKELLPLLGEGGQEATADSRDRELEDEQRDRDREDAVGERVEPVERQDIGGSGRATVRSPIVGRTGRSWPHRQVDQAPSIRTRHAVVLTDASAGAAIEAASTSATALSSSSWVSA